MTTTKNINNTDVELRGRREFVLILNILSSWTKPNTQEDSQQLSHPVSEGEVGPEQQHCGSSSLGQEEPEPTQIKEAHEELKTSPEEVQLYETVNFLLCEK